MCGIILLFVCLFSQVFNRVSQQNMQATLIIPSGPRRRYTNQLGRMVAGNVTNVPAPGCHEQLARKTVPEVQGRMLAPP